MFQEASEITILSPKEAEVLREKVKNECELNRTLDEKSQSYSQTEYCLTEFDSVSCWPPTKGGTIAKIPCPSHVPGVKITGTVYRPCNLTIETQDLNGRKTIVWKFDRSNYSDCVHHEDIMAVALPILVITVWVLLRIFVTTGDQCWDLDIGSGSPSRILLIVYPAIIMLVISEFKRVYRRKRYLQSNTENRRQSVWFNNQDAAYEPGERQIDIKSGIKLSKSPSLSVKQKSFADRFHKIIKPRSNDKFQRPSGLRRPSPLCRNSAITTE
ncbi:putative g-protein coupled receptor fragment [Schistosoma mansoni]|uniref:putative g-protein coupled receptor fragment n=1 Tax=Schistosoma mansoni TaxID=6183 RepID=UPI0001A62D60|nr:putative g-protein coupled receptor fragment [Schistosoma mansoni]